MECMHRREVVPGEIGLSFVSPVVSPGWVKMGRFQITRDDRNSYSRRLKAVIYILLMTSANSSKNAVLPLGNLRAGPFLQP
jgi:hypothetical protein